VCEREKENEDEQLVPRTLAILTSWFWLSEPQKKGCLLKRIPANMHPRDHMSSE
jgi:hypothetical protein